MGVSKITELTTESGNSSTSPSTQRIVVGYDGRPESGDALDLTIVLAEALEATVLIAAIETKRGLFTRGAALDQAARRPARTLADAQRRVAEAAPSLNVIARTVEARSPARGLRELCEDDSASLLVVGSSAHGGLERIMLGTTAERLCRESPCPVAIAPRGYRQRSAKELRVIAVAFDAGHEARRALAAAIALAERVPAALRVLGVLEPVRLRGAAVPPVDTGSTEPRFNRDVLDEDLERVLADLPKEIGGQRVVLEGEPVDALLETGARAADLLVLGSRPKGHLLALLPHSVSIGVAEAAPWPVVVVPAKAKLAPLIGEVQTWPLKDETAARS